MLLDQLQKSNNRYDTAYSFRYCLALDGYPLMTILIIKLVFVAAIWILGPIIDNVAEPKFKQLAPTVDQPASPEFGQIMNKYLALEITATSLFI